MTGPVGLVTDRSGVLVLGVEADTGTAVFSNDRVYRYALTRTWAAGPPVAFLMLNPSKAGAIGADPTIRRCIRYGHDWGAGGLIGLNAFGLVSTDPAGLLTHPDPVGPDNDTTILAYLDQPLTACVVAWGASRAVDADGGDRVRRVVDLIAATGHEPRCLAVTNSGHPGHPLRLRADATLSPWMPV